MSDAPPGYWFSGAGGVGCGERLGFGDCRADGSRLERFKGVHDGSGRRSLLRSEINSFASGSTGSLCPGLFLRGTLSATTKYLSEPSTDYVNPAIAQENRRGGRICHLPTIGSQRSPINSTLTSRQGAATASGSTSSSSSKAETSSSLVVSPSTGPPLHPQK